jgi:hypothetical protein
LKVIPYAAGSVDSSVAYQWRLPYLYRMALKSGAVVTVRCTLLFYYGIAIG